MRPTRFAHKALRVLLRVLGADLRGELAVDRAERRHLEFELSAFGQFRAQFLDADLDFVEFHYLSLSVVSRCSIASRRASVESASSATAAWMRPNQSDRLSDDSIGPVADGVCITSSGGISSARTPKRWRAFFPLRATSVR